MNHSQASFRQYSPPSRPRSFLDKMTKSEKTWGIIGLFFLFSGGFFLTFVIAFAIFYSVSEREKSKLRIVQILRSERQTSVYGISKILDKNEKHVDAALRQMILDEGASIRYDLVEGTVTAVGELAHSGMGAPAPVQMSQPVQTHAAPMAQPMAQPVAQPVVQQSAQPIAQSVAPMVTPMGPMDLPPVANSCMQCGEKLPKTAKYCNSCGVRQL